MISEFHAPVSRLTLFLLVLVFARFLSSAEVIIPRSAIWLYRDGTSEASSPVDEWRKRDFDESSWSGGPAPFRFGVGAGGTVLSDMQGNYSTVFLRRLFFLEPGVTLEDLRLSVDYDDGFAVWINGLRVVSVNGPASPLHDSVSTDSHESGSFESFLLDDPDDFLVEGLNVIAVQGFNSSLSSDDFLIDVELGSVDRVSDTKFSHDRGFYEEPFAVTITTSTPGATIRYTIDGSAPTETRGTIYSAPIEIHTTAVLRAIAYKKGIVPTNVDTQTYIFLEDVIRQPPEIPGWQTYDYPSGRGGPSTHDYEMDPEIVDAPAYSDVILEAMTAIPTMCLSMDRDEFWDVYRGDEEGAVSVELIYPGKPDAAEQVDCAVVRHSHNRVKNSLRLRFKKEFGATKFRSNIFRRARFNGESAVDEFDRIVLRAGNNRCWARNFNNGRCTYTRDQWYRDSQVATMGSGARGTFVHLYVNGIYWGLYNPCEKPDAWFASAYFGGEREDWWDSAGHGDPTRWNYVSGQLVDKDMTIAANYEELESYLDMAKYVDYVILTWMTGMTDWVGNNWRAVNRNNPAGPLLYYGWDCEDSWDTTYRSNLGAWVHPDFRRADSGGETLAALWNGVKHNEDFLLLFADRVYRHCFNDGALTDDRSRQRWAALNDVVREAVVAESARWGDATRAQPYTRDVDWQNEADRIDSLMNGNVARLMTALREEEYWPAVEPPLLYVDGRPLEVTATAIAAGFDVRVERNRESGAVYYTIDGSDPRSSGGSVSESAKAGGAAATVRVDGAIYLRARVLDGSEWSALRETAFHVLQDYAKLRITEIMYHPPDNGPIGGKQLEFLELKNVGVDALDLSGVEFSSGVNYAFPFGTQLEPDQHLVLVSNEVEFAKRYPGVEIGGVYRGSLSNGGETLTLSDFVDDVAVSVTYDDERSWPDDADGNGYSLVPTSRVPVGDPNDPMNWRRSAILLGSPGEDEGAVLEGTPFVERPPRNLTVLEGERPVFTVLATGYPLPAYQWRRDGVDIDDATKWLYVAPPALLKDTGRRYSCLVSNTMGSLETARAVLTVMAVPVRGELISSGATWAYLEGTEEASTPRDVWRDVDFPDSSWSSGPTPIGYGDPPFGTTLDDMRNGYSSVFLRRRFELPANITFTELTATVDYDDGFILWINGVDVLRVNAPSGEASFDDLAEFGHESGESEAYTLATALGWLKQGENVLAVQGFNVDISSSDFKLDVALSFEGVVRSVGEGSGFIRGDANADGHIDVADAVRTLLVLFAGRAAGACEDRHDVNDDGQLNLTDPIALLKFLFQGEREPLAPYPWPGEDPTDDALSCGGGS